MVGALDWGYRSFAESASYMQSLDLIGTTKKKKKIKEKSNNQTNKPVFSI